MNVTKKTGMKRLAKRLQEIEKGDKILDKAFNPYANGITQFSLAFWDTVKKYVDISKFTKAEMSYSPKQHYKFTLTHIDGFKLVFHGCSAGYHGEGSRGTHKILTESGFTHASRCFVAESFILKKTTR